VHHPILVKNFVAKYDIKCFFLQLHYFSPFNAYLNIIFLHVFIIMTFNDSVSDTNMRPFQGGQLETSTVVESSAVSGDVQPKPKRRKSDPKSWKKE